MDTFFSPSRVAIVGASAAPEKLGYEILKNVLASHRGDVFPINPTAQTILGKKCYRNILDVTPPIDLAILAVPPEAALPVIQDCGQKGIPSIVIVTGGFREIGKHELQDTLVTTAQNQGIRIIGPNCIGIFNGHTGFNTFFQTEIDLPPPGNIAILTQSGAFGIALLEWLARAHVGVSKFVSFGNKSDVDEIDLLTFLEQDPQTHVIGLYMEWLQKGKEFLSIARRVGKKKPIVILKAGRTTLGAHVALSHTGSMSQNDAVFSGAVTQAGCITAATFEEFYDILRILSLQPLPTRGSIGLVTNGAGPCVMAADTIHTSNHLTVAPLHTDTLQALKKSLPSFCIIDNPLDLTGSATADHYYQGMKTLMEDTRVGILMPFFVFQDAPIAKTLDDLYTLLPKITHYGKPIVAISTGGRFTELQGERLAGYNIPQIQDPVRAITALDKILTYTAWKDHQGP